MKQKRVKNEKNLQVQVSGEADSTNLLGGYSNSTSPDVYRIARMYEHQDRGLNVGGANIDS